MGSIFLVDENQNRCKRGRRPKTGGLRGGETGGLRGGDYFFPIVERTRSDERGSSWFKVDEITPLVEAEPSDQ